MVLVRMVIMMVFGGFALLACGGGADVGESCDTPGSTDECVGGAVCTPESGGGSGNACRKVCDRQEDCPTGETCNGLTGSLKSCQPDR